MHSFGLSQYLRQRFELAEGAGSANAKLDFWTVLQRRGMDLEALYSELETDSEVPSPFIEDFEAILRSSVVEPTSDRGEENVCRYHAMLVAALEPGDYIIDFNWDTVAADALLYRSHFWFPATGFGTAIVGTLLARSQKAFPVQSLVTLLHIHGSVCLYQPVTESASSLSGALYVGPRQWSAMTGMLAIMGIDPSAAKPGEQPRATRQSTEEEQARVARGWIFLKNEWLRAPIFVPPSKRKHAYDAAYVMRLRQRVHSLLPETEQLVIAGYSFPEADLPYLRRVFVSDILDRDIRLVVVNPSSDQNEFIARVEDVFPAVGHKDYSTTDFRLFCESLMRRW